MLIKVSDHLIIAIEITPIIKMIGDIREEIELCNRYYLLHDFPQFGTWGLFFSI